MTAFAHNYKLEDLCIDASAPQEEINALLGKTGAIVIKGLLSQDKVDAIRQDLKPHLQALGASGSKDQWDGDFFPSTTKKIPGLATKSPAYVENMILNPTLNGIAKHALERRTRTAFSFARHWSTCKPQINVTGILEVHPGSQAQTTPSTMTLLSAWTSGIPNEKNRFWHSVSFRRMADHLIGDDKGSPSYEDALQVRAEAGDCIVMQVGEDYSIRTMALCGWAAGYMRQEENQYVALDPEDVKKLSPEVQELLGWNMSLPYLGWVNWGHARAALVDDPKSVPQGDELFWDKDQSDLIAAH